MRVTVPSRVTGFEVSNSSAHEWWAEAGQAPTSTRPANNAKWRSRILELYYPQSARSSVWIERLPPEQKVVSSNLTGRTTKSVVRDCCRKNSPPIYPPTSNLRDSSEPC